MMCRVSVLLPVLNGAATIEPAIRSILQQSFADFELLVLDDGSTDDTQAIVQNLGDARVRWISDGRRLRVGARLNTGIDVARAPYIARMDADDLSFPERFERQVAYLDQHSGIDVVSSRALSFRQADLLPVGLTPSLLTHGQVTARPWSGIYVAHAAWMARASWYGRYRYRSPEVKRAEDQELLLRALPDSRYHCLPEVLYAIRREPFRFAKNFEARRSMLQMQVRTFIARRQWFNLGAAIAATAVKTGSDAMAAFPGKDGSRFMRKAEAVDAETHDRFSRLLAATGVVTA